MVTCGGCSLMYWRECEKMWNLVWSRHVWSVVLVNSCGIGTVGHKNWRSSLLTSQRYRGFPCLHLESIRKDSLVCLFCCWEFHRPSSFNFIFGPQSSCNIKQDMCHEQWIGPFTCALMKFVLLLALLWYMASNQLVGGHVASVCFSLSTGHKMQERRTWLILAQSGPNPSQLFQSVSKSGQIQTCHLQWFWQIHLSINIQLQSQDLSGLCQS